MSQCEELWAVYGANIEHDVWEQALRLTVLPLHSDMQGYSLNAIKNGQSYQRAFFVRVGERREIFDKELRRNMDIIMKDIKWSRSVGPPPLTRPRTGLSSGTTL